MDYMNEKTKLIVFAKKEILLLLIFFFLSVGLSFTLGFRMGADYSFTTTHEQQDRDMVDSTAQMKSTEEENVEKQQMEEEQQEQPIQVDELTKDTNAMMEKHLQDKLKEKSQPVVDNSSNTDDGNIEKINKDQLGGKYTIQVGSFRSLKEAEEFAKGFQMRGYSPIIEKADLQEKGVRFRVSLGAFDNVAEAREYISKERSLFLSQDYHIRPIE